MSSENSKKGRALEKAVGFIQETILKHDPKLVGSNCSVEFNQVFIISGARYEIDVLVKTLPNSPYESNWIFECKNWSESVGQDQAIILQKKVADIGASRGFLVARSLTSHAEALIQNDKRLSYIPWTNEFHSPLNDLEAVAKMHEFNSISAVITWRDSNLNVPELDTKKIKCVINGKPIEFDSFIEREATRLVIQEDKDNPAKYHDESSHFVERAAALIFQPNECSIDGLAVKQISIQAGFWIYVRKQKITSKFELKNQGRVFSIEMIDEDNPANTVQIDIVQRLSQ